MTTQAELIETARQARAEARIADAAWRLTEEAYIQAAHESWLTANLTSSTADEICDARTKRDAASAIRNEASTLAYAAERAARLAESAAAKAGAQAPEGTHDNPIRYAAVSKTDPDRQKKLAAQREQFGKDAKAGKVLCLSDLMVSHGM